MAAPQHLDQQALQELKGIMGDDFPLLIHTFITDSHQRLDAIRTALDKQDSDGLRRAAHSFKGSSGNLGALQVTDLCRQLEERGRDGETGADCPALLVQLTEAFQVVEREFTRLVN